MAGRLDKAAGEILDKAAEDYKQGRYEAAMKTYSNLLTWMPNSPATVKAREQLAAAEKDPAVQAALQEIRAKAFFARAVAIVQGKPTSTSQPAAVVDDPRESPITATDIQNLPVERQLTAVDTLQSLVRSYPATPQAEQCRGILARLDADPSFKAGLEQYRQTRDARQAFELGRSYESAGKAKLAAQQYRLACSKCPGSEWAKQSKKALAGLATLTDVETR